MVNVWCGMMNMVTKIICYNNELCGDDDDDDGGNDCDDDDHGDNDDDHVVSQHYGRVEW